MAENADGVSSDGWVVVGRVFNHYTQWRAFRWHNNSCLHVARGTGYTRHEDINKDGIVDDADLLVVLFNFGSGC
ncbi:MAG: hypothetical protein NZL85_11705 [Fimbriimonadales bacterium]|nr:hypothetical protein [Fimbriimonadales bacterium]